MSIYIYTLADPDTGIVRYVGKSTNPARRLRAHLCYARRHRKDHKTAWIGSLLDRSERPALSVIETCDADAWPEREQFWIEHYRKLGHDLTNHRDGGESGVFDAATRERMSLAARGRKPWNKGLTTPEDVRRKQSESAKKRWSDPEARRHQRDVFLKNRDARKTKQEHRSGWHHTDEARRKISDAVKQQHADRARRRDGPGDDSS